MSEASSEPGRLGRGEDSRIAYGFFDTPLGGVLLAATPSGLCALRLCATESAEIALEELRRDHPKAALSPDREAVQTYADELLDFLEGRSEGFRPRLDLGRGTPFQRRVWTALAQTDPGERVSYTELARRIGQPAAVRAVGGACAANRIAIAIPCHRAVRKDGALAGFRWGTDWKSRLLTWEAAQPEADP
jgi:AraC family transcriptional regulator of adaptative response/methylated-DNA-[protein]-cysteine methyltransferase